MTGKLSLTTSGPSIPTTLNSEGKVVLGGGDSDPARRRSIFINVSRQQPLDMLATFDQPKMAPNCDLRSETTVATQALWFLNDGELIQHADRLAEQLAAHSEDVDAQLRQLYLRLFSSEPTDSQRTTCREFLADQTAHFSGDEQAARRALASLCQVMLASNRFLYVD